jgi:hypothetical protein
MLTKEEVMKSMSNLPEHFSIDELIDRLVFIDKVEKGLAQSKENLVFSTQQAKQRLSKWLK